MGSWTLRVRAQEFNLGGLGLRNSGARDLSAYIGPFKPKESFGNPGIRLYCVNLEVGTWSSDIFVACFEGFRRVLFYNRSPIP